MSEIQRVRASPLAALDSLSVIASSARDCKSRVARFLPVRDAYPLLSGQDYAHKTASLQLGSLGVAVGLGSSFCFEVENHEVVTFLLSSGGRTRVRLGGATYGNSPDQPGLFLPGEAYHCEISEANGFVVTVRPERLASSALAMAQEMGADTMDLSVLQKPREVDGQSGRSAHLLALLSNTLLMLDGLHASSALKLQSEALEDLICRQIAGLLFPQLLRSKRAADA
jgi:hypothetical protein